MAKKEQAAPKPTKKVNYRTMTENIVYTALRIAVICVIFIIFYLGMTSAYRLGYHVFSDEAIDAAGSPSKTYTITIVEGQSPYNVGQKLEAKGIITDSLAFWIQSILYEEAISPGTYTVTSDMSSKEILQNLSIDPAVNGTDESDGEKDSE